MSSLPIGYSIPLLPAIQPIPLNPYPYSTIVQSLGSKFGITNYLLGIKLNISINLALYYVWCAHQFSIVSIFNINKIDTTDRNDTQFNLPVIYDLLLTSLAIIVLGQLLGSFPLWCTIWLGHAVPVDIQSIRLNSIYKLIYPIYYPNGTHYILHVIRTILLSVILVTPIYLVTISLLYIACTATNNDMIMHTSVNELSVTTCYVSSTTYTVSRAVYCGVFASITGPICYIANLCNSTIPRWALNGYHRKQDQANTVANEADHV